MPRLHRRPQRQVGLVSLMIGAMLLLSLGAAMSALAFSTDSYPSPVAAPASPTLPVVHGDVVSFGDVPAGWCVILIGANDTRAQVCSAFAHIVLNPGAYQYQWIEGNGKMSQSAHGSGGFSINAAPTLPPTAASAPLVESSSPLAGLILLLIGVFIGLLSLINYRRQDVVDR